MKKTCNCKKVAPQPVALPEFMRGNSVSLTSFVKSTTIAALPGTRVLLAGFSARRIGIGFCMAGAVAGAMYFNPFPMANANLGWTFSGNFPLWFDLTTYGPLVSNEWWGISAMGASLQVIEALTRE